VFDTTRDSPTSALGVCAGQQSLEASADFAVAFAGDLFETGAVSHDNAPAMLIKQPCRLERA